MKKNKIRDIITHYHWESVFFKHCFKWFLIILIPTFVIGLFISAFTYSVTNRNIKQSNDFNFQSINQETLLIFDQITDFHHLFSKDYDVLKLCLNMSEDNNDLSVTLQKVYSLISTFTATHDNIYSLYMYSPATDYVVGSDYSAYLNKFHDSEWISNDNTLVTSTVKKHNNSNLLSLKKNIILNDNSIATVVYNINLDTFTNSFISNTTIPSISFLSKDGNVLYCSKSFENEKITGSYSANIPNNLILSVNFIQTQADFIQIMSVVIFWLTFLILIAIDLVLSYNLALNYFKLVVENIMQFQSLYTYNEENDQLLQELDLMIHSHSKKIDQKDIEFFLINQYRQLNSLRMTSLQEQIKPHFIFNTLNLISLLDMDEESSPGLISKTARNLSEILRYSIENSSNMVSFNDEITYLDKYIEIQNIKYEEKFSFVKNFEDEINDCTVIKFILQPIVENAIIHGILTSPSKNGTITFSARNNNDSLIIDISNTGTMIPQHKLDSLNATLSNYMDSGDKHIGLVNVNNRIKLLFGEKYGIHISSDEILTTVTLKMPYIQ